MKFLNTLALLAALLGAVPIPLVFAEEGPSEGPADLDAWTRQLRESQHPTQFTGRSGDMLAVGTATGTGTATMTVATTSSGRDDKAGHACYGPVSNGHPICVIDGQFALSIGNWTHKPSDFTRDPMAANLMGYLLIGLDEYSPGILAPRLQFSGNANAGLWFWNSYNDEQGAMRAYDPSRPGWQLWSSGFNDGSGHFQIRVAKSTGATGTATATATATQSFEIPLDIDQNSKLTYKGYALFNWQNPNWPNARVREGISFCDDTSASIFGLVSTNCHVYGDYCFGGVCGYHAVEDHNELNMTGATNAYASFAASPRVVGSAAYDHLKGVQAWPYYAGSGPLGSLYGLDVYNSHTGTGLVSTVYGLHVWPTAGAGPIIDEYGVKVDGVGRGTNSNWGLHIVGGKNYLSGPLGVGTGTTDVPSGIAVNGGNVEIRSVGNYFAVSASQSKFGDASGIIAGGSGADTAISSYTSGKLIFGVGSAAEMQLDNSGLLSMAPGGYNKPKIWLYDDGTYVSGIGAHSPDTLRLFGDAYNKRISFGYQTRAGVFTEGMRLVDGTLTVNGVLAAGNVVTTPTTTGQICKTTTGNKLDPSCVPDVGSGVYIPLTQKGAANGVATLGSDGILSESQRPPSGYTCSGTCTAGVLAAFVGPGALGPSTVSFNGANTTVSQYLNVGSGLNVGLWVNASNIDYDGNTTGHAAGDIPAGTGSANAYVTGRRILNDIEVSNGGAVSVATNTWSEIASYSLTVGTGQIVKLSSHVIFTCTTNNQIIQTKIDDGSSDLVGAVSGTATATTTPYYGTLDSQKRYSTTGSKTFTLKATSDGLGGGSYCTINAGSGLLFVQLLSANSGD